VTFVAASGLEASSFGDHHSVMPSCIGHLPKALRIIAIVVVTAVDIGLIGVACFWNGVALVNAAGMFPTHWWWTVVLACVTLGVPVGAVAMLRGMLTEDSSQPLDARIVLRSTLVLLPLLALCCVVSVEIWL
jgi:hypothetical protein